MQSCLICDDHPLLRAAIAATVRAGWPQAAIIEAGDFPTAWAQAQADPDRCPDLCIADLSMPGATPLAGIDGLRAAAPDMRILVVTGSADDALLLAVLARGVAGFVPKSAAPGVIAAAIALIVAGGRYLPPRLAEIAAGAARPAVTKPQLTDRQIEILRLLAQGLSNKAIARTLNVSPATVKTHVAQVIAITGADNRTGAVMQAQALGVL